MRERNHGCGKEDSWYLKHVFFFFPLFLSLECLLTRILLLEMCLCWHIRSTWDKLFPRAQGTIVTLPHNPKDTFPDSKCGSCNSPDSHCHQPTDWLKPRRERELNHNVTLSAAEGPQASFLCPSWGWRWLIKKMSSRNGVSNTQHIHVPLSRSSGETLPCLWAGGSTRVTLHHPSRKENNHFWLTFCRSNSQECCCFLCNLT